MVLGRGRAPAHAGRGFMNRILIVSDDIFLRDMVRLSLIDMRTEVRCAADADEMEGLCRLLQLRKIIGQVQAIDRMVDEDVPCEDILSQINAAKSALHRAGQVVLEGHIKHCVRDGIEHGDADKTIESFTKAVERFSNMG